MRDVGNAGQQFRNSSSRFLTCSSSDAISPPIARTCACRSVVSAPSRLNFAISALRRCAGPSTVRIARWRRAASHQARGTGRDWKRRRGWRGVARSDRSCCGSREIGMSSMLSQTCARPRGHPLSPVTLPAGENHRRQDPHRAFRRRRYSSSSSAFRVRGLRPRRSGGNRDIHVVHAVSTAMIWVRACSQALHRQPVDEFYSIQARGVVKAPLGQELQFG